MYTQDTIYFTCMNVEESRNLVQNFRHMSIESKPENKIPEWC